MEPYEIVALICQVLITVAVIVWVFYMISALRKVMRSPLKDRAQRTWVELGFWEGYAVGHEDARNEKVWCDANTQAAWDASSTKKDLGKV